jgi:hypothetical protein
MHGKKVHKLNADESCPTAQGNGNSLGKELIKALPINARDWPDVAPPEEGKSIPKRTLHSPCKGMSNKERLMEMI